MLESLPASCVLSHFNCVESLQLLLPKLFCLLYTLHEVTTEAQLMGEDVRRT